jgi:trehalose/maltose hydrolase-like predicted phosphorylase
VPLLLNATRNNAKLSGRRGIQFPWESRMALGEESSPRPGTGAWHEDHVTLDVALAFAQYAHATGDASFLREQAWPVLQGVAEWICSRVDPTERGYEITRGTGIAERKEPSDNDAFTQWRPRSCSERPSRADARLAFSCGITGTISG